MKTNKARLHFVLVTVYLHIEYVLGENIEEKLRFRIPIAFASGDGAFATRIGVERVLKVTSEGVAAMQVRLQILVRSHNRFSFCFQLPSYLQQSSGPRGTSLGHSKTLFFWPQNIHFCSFLERE